MYFYEGCTIKEVQAMRDLQNESFDFGSGLITVDCKESEDIYMKMHLQMFYDWNYCDDDLDSSIEIAVFIKDKSRAKRRRNNYRANIKNKESNKFKNYKNKWMIHNDIYGRCFFRDLKSKPHNIPSEKRKILDCDYQLKDNYAEWRYLDYADHEDRQWSLLEDWDCYRFYEEYLAKIKLYEEEEKIWNEEYKNNKDWYDGHDDY